VPRPGRAGAFLVRDWNAGAQLDTLARRGFALHSRLPDEVDADWDHRDVTAYTGYVAGPAAHRRGEHPGRFTEAMMGAARRQGAERCTDGSPGWPALAPVRAWPVPRGRRTRCRRRRGGRDGAVVDPGGRLAAAAGRLPGQGHSIVFDTGTAVPPDALLPDYQDETAVLRPEVFPRADGSSRCAPGCRPALDLNRILVRQACHRPVARTGCR
jgi:hypothetical protein